MNRPLSRTLITGLIVLVLIVILVLVLLVGHAAAHPAYSSGGSYELSWWAIAGGGVTSSAGGSYSLGGTIGQPAAGTSSGGAYHLIGGFWAVTQQLYKLFLPLSIR